MGTYEEKCRELTRRIDELTKNDVAVAFSGGVDSSLLLKLAALGAKKNGTAVWAMTAATELHPVSDTAAAVKIAREVGAKHKVLHLNELEEAGIQKNPVDRCYRCKKYLFASMQKAAATIGVSTILEGTNADDLQVYRPGLRALLELGIVSPLKEADFTKEEVRQFAREHAVTAANRPAAPCLATRFPYGTELTRERLQRIEQGETFLKTFGFYNVRLRAHGDCARIEVDPEDFSIICEKSKEIAARLNGLGFHYVTLDLAGFRSGSMDIYIK